MSWKYWINKLFGDQPVAASEAEAIELPPESHRVKTLIVSRAIWRRTFEYFQPYYKARVETACFWFGIDAEHIQVATTIAVPKLFQTGGNYSVEKNSMRRLAAEMREQKLTNLAQIHTHPPGCGVKHSPYDDLHGYSTRQGALSLVWSDYGLQLRPDLKGVGVHERCDGEWILLDEMDASKRIILVDDFADLRWDIQSGGIGYEE
jgi:hypothetical protein